MTTTTTTPTPLQDREVLVLGLGASGLALVRWCVRAGARVTVADTRAAPPHAATLKAELPEVQCLYARFDAALFQRSAWALVCRSPGITPADMAELACAAQAAGVAVVGELGLFAQALHALAQPGPDGGMAYTPKVLAITGTNGKTTTTALTAHLLRAAGWNVAVAGNIGPTLLDVLRQRIDGADLPQAWVLELSSFQLHGVQGFEPSAAAVLNVTQDHLDWHGDMQSYAAAKARVFGSQGVMVLNRDDPLVWGWQPQPTPARRERRSRSAAVRPYTSFGADVPGQPGDWGLETVHGMTWLVRAVPLDDTLPKRRAGTGAAEPAEFCLQRLMPAEALRIRGRHNACNALAALALASAAGAALAPMLHALRDYAGEPHRVEPVGIVAEVEYIDDSKGTNVGATLAAITGLGAERRLVLILGGDGKGQDFSALAPAVARHARAVALIGQDAPAIRTVLEGTGVPLHDAATLPQAVRWCAQQARPGDAVVLSPACASLDMFQDYAHRAAVFVEAVRELQMDEGTPA